ncbi:TniQ family protein [Burkholderia thailandensis]|uniref:TniQ family protein n=1 Tax=Burkholderia thailandensis TaxID=57975 RepID=UPI0009E3B730
MPTTSNSLLLAPDPISGESPSSWLQRLSLMHAVSTRTLLRSMGIRHVGDPDVDLTPHVYSTLVQGTNVSEACVDHLAGIYQHVSEEAIPRHPVTRRSATASVQVLSTMSRRGRSSFPAS